jgi:predicted glycogen debranching enzyme
VSAVADGREWLETDGLGGFASGTVSGIRTRRYHALLLAATQPPAGRFVLVNGVEAHVETASGTHALSSHRYSPDVLHPDGATRVVDFRWDPWPRWTFALGDGTRIEHEVLIRHEVGVVGLSWRVASGRAGTLRVRPLLSGRDPHSLHHANAVFRFGALVAGEDVTWRPYPGVPGIVGTSNGVYRHAPEWFYNFLYTEERARGLDHVEDLASPGVFELDLARGEAVLLLRTDVTPSPGPAPSALARVRAAERERRAAFPSKLHRAGDAYIVRRGNGRTIVAGYPWFGDWGRDTFIALRGLCLSTGRLADARRILLEWASAVSQGMLPNRFPDRGDAPEFNSVDAALFYVVAVQEYLEATQKQRLAAEDGPVLREAVEAIVSGYARGTRFGIRLDDDGLLAAGVPGVQLTWMDAKVGDWVVTPRIGKPVEVEALWLNALAFAGEREPRWNRVLERGLAAFRSAFWNAERASLHDVIDVDHRRGVVDSSFRPNQVLAAGGLPLMLLPVEQARQVVDAVEKRLWTPLGLRSLAAGEPGYAPRYEGGVRERDGAYHQGTVWPWLAGPFLEAWVRVRGGGSAVRHEARKRFLEPLLGKLDVAGLGHLPEVAHAEPPHTPGGCPFQAWSTGELLRALELCEVEEGSLAHAPC